MVYLFQCVAGYDTLQSGGEGFAVSEILPLMIEKYRCECAAQVKTTNITQKSVSQVKTTNITQVSGTLTLQQFTGSSGISTMFWNVGSQISCRYRKILHLEY